MFKSLRNSTINNTFNLTACLIANGFLLLVASFKITVGAGLQSSQPGLLYVLFLRKGKLLDSKYNCSHDFIKV